MSKKKIVIFASGSGSNAQIICAYFNQNKDVEVAAIYSNKATAGALQIAKQNNIKSVYFTPQQWESDFVLNELLAIKPQLIVLAGFLKRIPEKIIAAFPNQIINIHPSLLPKFGGAGMYGMHVHQAVLNAQEKVSGITIHYVDKDFDTGKIIAQYKTQIGNCITAEQIAKQVQKLEHAHFAKEIEKLLTN